MPPQHIRQPIPLPPQHIRQPILLPPQHIQQPVPLTFNIISSYACIIHCPLHIEPGYLPRHVTAVVILVTDVVLVARGRVVLSDGPGDGSGDVDLSVGASVARPRWSHFLPGERRLPREAVAFVTVKLGVLTSCLRVVGPEEEGGGYLKKVA